MSAEREESLLTAYIDGELGPQEVKEVEAALAREPHLRELEQRLRRTVSAMKTLAVPQASPSLRRAVLNAIGEAPREPWWTRFWLPAVGLATAGVVAALVLSPPESAMRGEDLEHLFVAQNLELLEDYDVVGMESADDLEVVSHLHELEATP